VKLTLRLGNKKDLAWAQVTVAEYHYLKQRVDPRARSMAYIIEGFGQRLGLVMIGIPHATRCRGWFGYPGLPTQWQVVDLNRIWLDPCIQKDGRWCSPETVPGFIDRKGVWRSRVASWAIETTLARVQCDRVSLWPPVYPEQPYHILLALSYHDPKYHKGVIYRETKASPMYTNSQGEPIPGPSGKFGWCWRLPEPTWKWQDIEILQPRTMRLPMM
jgi:hypothetical protein